MKATQDWETYVKNTIWKELTKNSDKQELRKHLCYYYAMHNGILQVESEKEKETPKKGQIKREADEMSDPVATGFGIIKAFDQKEKITYCQFTEPFMLGLLDSELILQTTTNPNNDPVFQVLLMVHSINLVLVHQ